MQPNAKIELGSISRSGCGHYKINSLWCVLTKFSVHSAHNVQYVFLRLCGTRTVNQAQGLRNDGKRTRY